MKVIIAPDKYKECLGASKVAQAMARGVLEVLPDAVIDLCPMADGGDGTAEAMVAATGGKMLATDVYDPLGAPIRAHFGLLGSNVSPHLPGELGLTAAVSQIEGQGQVDPAGATAVIEMAAASGLTLVPLERRDPMRTSTFGTGKLIQAALDAGASKIIIGLGGSATVDGGCGCAQALGVAFLDGKGQLLVCGLSGGQLSQIECINMSGLDSRLGSTTIRVACDVRNPLTGPDGAAAVFGPQKGATPEMVRQLDEGLHHLANVVRRQLGIEIENLPGAGAAGGLGAGLVAFAGAKLENGFSIVAQAVGLKRRLADADIVITGEGKLDRSSGFGKTAVGVARLAAKPNGPAIICIPGQLEDGAPLDLFTLVHPLVDPSIPPKLAMRKTAELLQLRTAQALRKIAKAQERQ